MYQNNPNPNPINPSSCFGITYKIKRGDTLYSISRRYNVAIAQILRANPFIDVYNLQIGEDICIPVPNSGNIPNLPGVGVVPIPITRNFNGDSDYDENAAYVHDDYMPEMINGRAAAEGRNMQTMPAPMQGGAQTPSMEARPMPTPTPAPTPMPAPAPMPAPMPTPAPMPAPTPRPMPAPTPMPMPAPMPTQRTENMQGGNTTRTGTTQGQMPRTGHCNSGYHMWEMPDMMNDCTNYRPMPLPAPPMQGAVKPSCPSSRCSSGSVAIYVIKDRDTISDILDFFGIELEDLLQMNNLSNIMLKPGMAINIPVYDVDE